MYLKVKGKEIRILHAKAEDWEGAMALAWRTFSVFEAPYYEKRGSESFIDFISGNDLKRMFLMGRYRMYLAKDGEELRGLISVRENNHISLLFVDEHWQHCGIGSALICCVEDYLWERETLPLDNEEEKILDLLYVKNEDHFVTVNAAPTAVDFYKRNGFTPTGPEAVSDGMSYVPMILHEKR